MGDKEQHPSQIRRLLQLAVLCAIAALILWLALGDGGSRISAFLTRPPNPAPRPSPTVALVRFPCQLTQLELVGAFEGCADAAAPCDSARNAAPDYFSAILRINDRTHTYLLYLVVDGGYHGPDRYVLGPWTSAGITSNDRITKVMVRDAGTGDLWQSNSGSLTIQAPGTRGMVKARLEFVPGPVFPQGSPFLNIDGPWSCT